MDENDGIQNAGQTAVFVCFVSSVCRVNVNVNVLIVRFGSTERIGCRKGGCDGVTGDYGCWYNKLFTERLLCWALGGQTGVMGVMDAMDVTEVAGSAGQ